MSPSGGDARISDSFVFPLFLQSVLVSVFYSKPQRLDIYIDNQLVAPTNAEWNADNTDYTLKRPISQGTDCPLYI